MAWRNRDGEANGCDPFARRAASPRLIIAGDKKTPPERVFDAAAVAPSRCKGVAEACSSGTAVCPLELGRAPVSLFFSDCTRISRWHPTPHTMCNVRQTRIACAVSCRWSAPPGAAAPAEVLAFLPALSCAYPGGAVEPAGPRGSPSWLLFNPLLPSPPPPPKH